MIWLVLAATVAATPPPPAAWGQLTPLEEPTRDVTVTYLDSGGDTLTWSWMAQGRRARIDIVPGEWTVADARTGQVRVVDDTYRSFYVVDAREDAAGPRIPARYERIGADRVLGLPCVIWTVEEKAGESVKCITADGVVLRQEGAPSAGAKAPITQATAVSFAPVDPTRFMPPADYLEAPFDPSAAGVR